MLSTVNRSAVPGFDNSISEFFEGVVSKGIQYLDRCSPGLGRFGYQAHFHTTT